MLFEELRKKCRRGVEEKEEIFFWDKIQRNISLVFVAIFLELGVTSPDIATLLSLGASIGGATCLITGNIFFAFFFYQLHFILDCVDGDLARYHNVESDVGTFKDRLVHIVNEPLLFIASGIASGNVWYGVIPAICCQNGIRLIQWGFDVSTKNYSNEKPAQQPIFEKIARFVSIYGFTFVLLLNSSENLRTTLIFWSFWTLIACIYVAYRILETHKPQKHTLILKSSKLIDERTFEMIENIIQRMYIPYELIYRGRKEKQLKSHLPLGKGVSSKGSYDVAIWEIQISSNVKNFYKLVGVLESIYEFGTNDNPPKQISFEVK